MAIPDVLPSPMPLVLAEPVVNPVPTRAKFHWAKVREVFLSLVEGIREDRELIPMKVQYYKEVGAIVHLGRNECHVRCSARVRQTWFMSRSEDSLCLWIERGLGPHRVAKREDGLIVYFSESDCLEALVRVREGGLLQRGETLEDDDYLYVLTRENRWLLCPKVELSCGASVKHSSLSRGKPVRAAGVVKVREGRVIRISNDSGHYRPGAASMRTMIRWLAEQGVSAESYVLDLSVKNRGLGYRFRTFAPAELF